MPDLIRTPEERALLARAARALPGGTLGNVRMDDDYAFIVAGGQGSRIRDVSGNEYIDYLLGSGPMVLGHAHPKVIEAATAAMAKGTTFFAQNAYAVELAERIVEAMPCAEQARFVSSGTEATYNALKVARAFRKRDKILKFEGGFHGMNDYSQMSLSPSGKTPFPQPEPSSAGIPKAVQETVLVAPFNDLNAVEDLLDRYHDELAAVIVEPVQRVIEPQPGFLQGLRELTDRYGVLLVFDEVVTGFPPRLRRRAGALRRRSRPLGHWQDRRRGLSPCGRGGPPRAHGALRRQSGRTRGLRPPDRHAKRQSRRGGSRTRDPRGAA